MEDEATSGSNAGLSKLLNDSDERPRSAVNSVVLDYYKKFGRKRDLEQYFSLTTAQSDIRDPRSLFWRRMKEQSDTSDSGEKKSESSNEICRISIKCSIPERGTSQNEKGESQSNNESESPPIIMDVLPLPSPSGDESMDDNHSQKSADATLDTSINKPLSPTSSITSQRKLEWDSLADVGYGNESDKKTSASSLSTLEREVLAQKQQYTLDYKQTSSDLGLPTAHSTPVDPNDNNPKGKKGLGKKTISISRKDVDFVEFNVPHIMENVQPINVNLTKQFSVNLQKDGGMTIDNVKKDISISPEKNVDAEINTGVKLDKEVQTSLLRSKEKDKTSKEISSTSGHKIPIMIGLNTLRRKHRRKKIKKSRIKGKSKQKLIRRKEVITEKDKSGEQVSEAESFEYMPGHMYNQNQLRKQDPNIPNNNNSNVGNKSSLESSAVHTTDSSKESKYSFTKDLDKTLNVLKSTLKDKYDSNLKKKLVTDIIQRLLKSNYGEGETTPEFLSVLSLTSKKTPTTSTSEADNTDGKVAHSKPKKSILRTSKFDPRNVASTSQSAPNLPSVVESDKPVTSYLSKIVSSTTTETDMSNNSAKDVTSSDTVFEKTSSQELYKKYINALKKEEAYKQHLRDKEQFLKQKLVRTEHVTNVPVRLDLSKNTNLKNLIKDLTRNNYDDGSGDASILEGGSSNFDLVRQRVPRKHRSHSVFTLTSGNSDMRQKTCNTKSRLQNNNMNSPRAGPSNWNRNFTESCNKPAVTDSSVQVNINVHDNPPKTIEEAKFVCLCTAACHHSPEEIEVFKCPISKPIHNPKALINNRPVCGIHSGSSSLKEDVNACTKHPKKEKVIHECTRCLQTKLSIHPKISDPSETDINIMDSEECVKLINELYRKVTKSSSECRCSNEQDCNSYSCKSSKDNMRRNRRNEQDNLIEDVNQVAPLMGENILEENVIKSRVDCQKTFTNEPESPADNIVIPIQGTNMMLKLSIGGKTLNVQNDQIPNSMPDRTNKIDREINTDKFKTSTKGISIFDECSKSVQAESSSIINKPSCSLKTNTEKDFSPQDPAPDSERAGRSTYPKRVQINEKKPLLRSNSDTGNLGASAGTQRDTMYTKDNESIPYFRTKTDPDFVSQKQSRSINEGRTRSQSIKGTSNEHSHHLGASAGIQRDTMYTKDNESLSYFRTKTDPDFASQKQSRSINEGRIRSQSIKGTSNEHSIAESSKSSSGERFHSSKNKLSAERQKLKEQNTYDTDEVKPKDLILDVIKDITKRYSKRDTDKHSKKKCFKEIITALSYLLDTDDSGDGDQEFSQSSKGLQCSREQGSQSGRNYNDFRNNSEMNKTLGEKSGTITISPVNVFPQKSNTYERMKTDSSSRENKQNRRFSEACGVAKPDNNFSTKVVPPLKLTCDMGCGCDGTTECNDCMGPSVKTDPGSSGRITPRTGNSGLKIGECQQSSRHGCNSQNNIKTCDMGCGCDGSSECKDCGESYSPTYDGSSRRNKESAGTKIQQSRCNSAKEAKTTCDEGCGCDGSSECKDCGDIYSPKHSGSSKCNKESPRSKIEESKCSPPSKRKTTCDKGCGCDGSSECKDCLEPHSPKHKSRPCKESEKPKTPEMRFVSPKKTKTTCDKACGCDASSECDDCVESHAPKYTIGDGKECRKSRKQDRCTSPKKTETCDRSSSEFSDYVRPKSPKNEIGKCRKTTAKPIKQDRCVSPKKIETCDRACGCDDSAECIECVESHSSNYGSGKCGRESMKPKKQDRCTSPRRPKTSDNRTASECDDRQQSRSNSPKKIRSMCDKNCGCDGSSVCKDCSHKTGRCARSKRQDAKKFVNKCVQSVKRVRSLYSHHCDESSDIPVSTDPPCCSTDSPTTKFMQKIKKECEKYQKRCKACKKCGASSTTSVSCDHCRRAERHFRHHRCRCHRSKSTDKIKKKCVAYNLIVQTSDSLISEETVFDRCRPLQNVIVKVPKFKHPNVPFKEVCAKIERKLPYCDTRFEPKGRSQSWPNECAISSTDDVKIANACTVRDYLEINRPDFVNRCESRQNCIRMTSESRAKERSELREQLVGLESLPTLTDEEIIYLAKQLGHRRNRPLQQKIMSEREMKKHSEKIYKSLPEVVQKKEHAKKENSKKTNLLMANIFKKNLQKKALNGNVNISNYSQVVKI